MIAPGLLDGFEPYIHIFTRIQSPLAFLSICALFAFGVTTKPGSILRYATFLMTFAPLWYVVKFGHTFSNSDWWNGTMGAFGCMYVLSSFVILILKGYQSTFWEGCFMMSSPRFTSTVFQVKAMQNWAKYYGKDFKVGKEGPSRGAFLLRQSFIWLWVYLLMDLCLLQDNKTPDEERVKSFPPGSEFDFEWTLEQWTFRISIGIVAWFVVGRAGLEGITTLFSILFVGSGLQTPAQCPPNFGSMTQSYTLRKFWGTFWHQGLRFPMTELANFICRDVLHLPHPSFIERYTNLFIVFTTSGVIHIFYNWVTLREGVDLGTMAFFQASALLIMIEDGIQAIGRKISGVNRDNESVPLWKKILGFVWVFFCLAIVSPFILTVGMRTPLRQQQQYPWSLGTQLGVEPVIGLITFVSAINLLYFKVEI